MRYNLGFYRSLIENLHDGVYFVDPERLSGYTSNDVKSLMARQAEETPYSWARPPGCGTASRGGTT